MTERLVKQPSSAASQAHFADVPMADIERSTFDRSNAWKGTIDLAGQLVPMYWDEVLPGDTFNVNATVFTRLATPLKPFFDNLKMDLHFFFVPNRIIWDNWARFMGERRDPTDDPDNFTIPQAQVKLADPTMFGTLADSLGLPIGQGSDPLHVTSVSDLPFRAYNLIHYEWYRDQNVQDQLLPPATGDDPADRSATPLKIRNKRKDYFTSCLPFAQKGDPVVIPIGQSAPVISTGDGAPTFDIGTTVGDRLGQKPGGDTTGAKFETATEGGSAFVPGTWNDPKLLADLTGATATSINDLRTAFQIQRLLERDARGGTRLIELVLSHFGVHSDDLRAQRPQLLGFGTGHINLNPIGSTVPIEVSAVPQGNLAATGTGLAKGGFTHSFTEHGIVMCLASIQADLTYQQGIEKYWRRASRYDFYWPALAHLGEQQVKQEELYYSGDPAQDDLVFGYQERYGEYRFRPSRITGQFRSNHPTSLDVWHLAQDFDAPPVLNGAFINEDPPIERVIAVPSEPHFLCDAWFDVKSTRPMPVYSVPGMIDHF